MPLTSEKIEFKIKKNNVIIDTLLTLNHEEKTYTLKYYDSEGIKYNNIPKNPYNKTDPKYKDYETIRNNFKFDTFIYDLITSYIKEKSIHIILKDYELYINP